MNRGNGIKKRVKVLVLESQVFVSDIHFQEFGSIFSVQHSDHNDVVNSPNIHAFSREAFAPKVMPWFKAKRKATNK
jgi:hypothetical protein